MADTRDDFIIAVRYALLKKGAKQRFSLFFLISLSILIVTLDKLSVPFIQTTRAILNDVVYEIAVVAGVPGNLLGYLIKEKDIHFSIVEKNKALEKEVEALKRDRYDNLFLKTENESLKQALNFYNILTDDTDTLVVGKVLLDQESPFLKSFIINKGKKDGIIKGMTVFSKSYLIGTIVESNFLTSRVLLITDLNSKVSVILQDTGVNAILTGAGKKTNLILEYLPEDFEPAPNKIIYTSGKDGFLAAGLPIAETYLNDKNELKIKSLADPQQASIVHVVRRQLNK
jgi:rod shape-determining protein MreC